MQGTALNVLLKGAGIINNLVQGMLEEAKEGYDNEAFESTAMKKYAEIDSSNIVVATSFITKLEKEGNADHMFQSPSVAYCYFWSIRNVLTLLEEIDESDLIEDEHEYLKEYRTAVPKLLNVLGGYKWPSDQ